MYTRDQPLLMIPGPTPLSPRVRRAMADPVRGHGSPENAAAVARIRTALGALGGMADADAFVVPGSGTLAMEMALVNHARVGDRVVVVNHGYFADRFVDICTVHGMVVDQVRAPSGAAADPGDVRAVLAGGPRPALLIVTHVDTSTGVAAPVADIAAVAAEAGVMVLLDGVCATGGMVEDCDRWGVDILVTASQKALAAPPGLAMVIASPRARERRMTLGPPASYYLDMARWEPAMTSTAYFATHATTLIHALDVSLAEIGDEGLGERYARHLEVAAAAREGFASLGFAPLTAAGAVAPTLSVLRPPEGVAEAALRAALLEAGVLVAPTIGAFAGMGIRVGHMGAAGRDELAFTLDATRGALAQLTSSARP